MEKSYIKTLILSKIKEERSEIHAKYYSQNSIPGNHDEQVKNNKLLALKLLPSEEGFFFGSYKYDKDYFWQIKDTIKMLDICINEATPQSDFYYQSSW